MEISEYFSKDIMEEAIDLHKNGIKSWALTESGVSKLLEKISGQAIAIAGGDVYVRRNDCLYPTGDNWYTDKSDKEWTQYVKDSIEQTKNYIKKYPKSIDNYYDLILISYYDWRHLKRNPYRP